MARAIRRRDGTRDLLAGARHYGTGTRRAAPPNADVVPVEEWSEPAS